MKKLCLVSVFLLISYVHGYAQDSLKIPKNSVFVELLGNGGIYSLNYEREAFNKMLARVGISYMHDGESGIPIGVLTIGKYFGEGKNHFEIDGGLTYINGVSRISYYSSESREHILFVTAFVGYRYHKPEGKFLFRIGLTPFYSIKEIDDDAGSFFVSGGVSFGYRF